ncbi:major facilitator superfamily transporter [Trichoderma arundinaceum]|uniref:Major facilitator superfamily transporter n=1 Tax=Trichoderma arundinaceum TaxID=490622 RepID=A0A395P186_TRIAR|nr:major facilitator superfamily transporter [Trichoderma arundinaceum]
MWTHRDSIAYEKLDSATPSYRAIPTDTLETTRRQVPLATRGCSRFLVLGIIITLPTFVAIVVFGGILLSRTWKPLLSQITITASIPDNYCGSSPAEAKAAGCAFELNNFAWMHPDCYDAELDEDWTHGHLSNELEFWEQYGGVGSIPMQVVETGQVEKVWVSTKQHRRHCLFVWEKYQRAAMDVRPMDNWTADYKHTQHCIMLLRNENNKFPDEEVSSYLTLKYPTCEYGPVQISITPQN